MSLSASETPLAAIEPRLRTLLPASLYAQAWVDPSPATLGRVFEHLRSFQRNLQDYVPRHVAENLTRPGQVSYAWQEGTLMFTDLAGFTPLMEANAAQGQAGARALLSVLNAYFAEMIEIISKAGGNLLEFTGDALLALFPSGRSKSDTAQAIRAGLRMQRAMRRFTTIETPQGPLALGMRVGIHAGRVLTMLIGTPRRMEYALLDSAVQQAKHAEGSGIVGQVCLTEIAYQRVQNQFRFQPGKPGYQMVVDDLTDKQLGEYDLAPMTRRMSSSILLDRSITGLIASIEETVQKVEPLASFLPLPIVNLLVENPARHKLPPSFPHLTAMFVNLLGYANSVDQLQPQEEAGLVNSFSRAFALINAAVEARGGVLKNVTCHLAGSDIMIYFGAPTAHTDDSLRAAEAALAIREIVAELPQPLADNQPVQLSCQIGLAHGSVFTAEIGEPRGRREFNVLGDIVNTAARLMGRAGENQILATAPVFEELESSMVWEPLGVMPLKGKAEPIPIYSLLARKKG